MRVGHHYGVEPPHPRIDHLLAQIGRGVDQSRDRADFDQHRGAAPVVAGVGRVTTAPIRSGSPALRSTAPQPRIVTLIGLVERQRAGPPW